LRPPFSFFRLSPLLTSSLLSSDTFWLDMRALRRLLSKYNPEEDWFGSFPLLLFLLSFRLTLSLSIVGASTEAQRQLEQFGTMAFGGVRSSSSHLLPSTCPSHLPPTFSMSTLLSRSFVPPLCLFVLILFPSTGRHACLPPSRRQDVRLVRPVLRPLPQRFRRRRDDLSLCGVCGREDEADHHDDGEGDAP
jgi:hypothetical protein